MRKFIRAKLRSRFRYSARIHVQPCDSPNVQPDDIEIK